MKKKMVDQLSKMLFGQAFPQAGFPEKSVMNMI
jgi:hypothetical protein